MMSSTRCTLEDLLGLHVIHDVRVLHSEESPDPILSSSHSDFQPVIGTESHIDSQSNPYSRPFGDAHELDGFIHYARLEEWTHDNDNNSNNNMNNKCDGFMTALITSSITPTTLLGEVTSLRDWHQHQHQLPHVGTASHTKKIVTSYSAWFTWDQQEQVVKHRVIASSNPIYVGRELIRKVRLRLANDTEHVRCQQQAIGVTMGAKASTNTSIPNTRSMKILQLIGELGMSPGTHAVLEWRKL